MTLERLSVLEHVKFPFALRGDEFWKANYDRLREYHSATGHCRVPHSFAPNPKLGEFVTDQRRQQRLRLEGKPSLMTDERKAKLDALGFEFSIRERVGWDQRLTELLQYRNAHGNCEVPQNYAPNKALGKWVAKQREQYRIREKEGKKSSLTDERMKKLEDIGFTWAIHQSKRDKSAGAAVATEALSPTAGNGATNNQLQQHTPHTAPTFAPAAQIYPQPHSQAEAVPPSVRPQKRQKTAPPILLPLHSEPEDGPLEL